MEAIETVSAHVESTFEKRLNGSLQEAVGAGDIGLTLNETEPISKDSTPDDVIQNQPITNAVFKQSAELHLRNSEGRLSNEPIRTSVTKQSANIDQSKSFNLPNEGSSDEDGGKQRIQKLRSDIQAFAQLKRKTAYSPETGVLRKSQSLPQLLKETKKGRSASFINAAFEGDQAMTDVRTKSMSDVVQSLLRDPIKEDVHPYGRGNIYQSMFDSNRPRTQYQEGKLFMWALGILIVLGLAGSVIVMSLMYQPFYYQNVNATSTTSNDE